MRTESVRERRNPESKPRSATTIVAQVHLGMFSCVRKKCFCCIRLETIVVRALLSSFYSECMETMGVGAKRGEVRGFLPSVVNFNIYTIFIQYMQPLLC